jgi:hypothetical protein
MDALSSSTDVEILLMQITGFNIFMFDLQPVMTKANQQLRLSDMRTLMWDRWQALNSKRHASYELKADQWRRKLAIQGKPFSSPDLGVNREKRFGPYALFLDFLHEHDDMTRMEISYDIEEDRRIPEAMAAHHQLGKQQLREFELADQSQHD